jgi:hypothetical protein
MYQWLLDPTFDFDGQLATLERLIPEWLAVTALK